jgi:hypothetical protein
VDLLQKVKMYASDQSPFMLVFVMFMVIQIRSFPAIVTP